MIVPLINSRPYTEVLPLFKFLKICQESRLSLERNQVSHALVYRTDKFRPCLVELWLWEKADVGCELWKNCCGLWAVEKLKAVWLNKYKIYLLSLSLLKQLWKSFLFHQFRKAESQKPKAGSNQLSKMNYGKAAASEKAPSKNSSFN